MSQLIVAPPKFKRLGQAVITQICNKHVRDNMSSVEIAQWLIDTGRYRREGNLDSVASLVRKIIYRYRASLELDLKHENIEQVIRIKRRIAFAGHSKKDAHDWEALLDSKISPKKVEVSGTVNIELAEQLDAAINRMRDYAPELTKVNTRN